MFSVSLLKMGQSNIGRTSVLIEGLTEGVYTSNGEVGDVEVN